MVNHRERRIEEKRQNVKTAPHRFNEVQQIREFERENEQN
jgi:hypothetical protein